MCPGTQFLYPSLLLKAWSIELRLETPMPMLESLLAMLWTMMRAFGFLAAVPKSTNDGLCGPEPNFCGPRPEHQGSKPGLFRSLLALMDLVDLTLAFRLEFVAKGPKASIRVPAPKCKISDLITDI